MVARLESPVYALRGTPAARGRAKAARWLFIGLLPALLACGAKTQSQPTIRDGNARFEFLTPSLVRMEYSPAGTFIDAPTAVVQKRDWPAVQVQSMQKDGWLIAATSAMTLRYRLGSGAFTVTNLSVTWNDPPAPHTPGIPVTSTR
jgi:hypothetical protein